MSLQESLVAKPADHMEHAAPAAPAKKSKCASVIVSLILFINTFFLVAVLVAVISVRNRVEHTLDKVDNIIDEVQSGKPSAGTLETTNTVLSSAASYFLLGEGSIAGYLQNLFLYDFSGLAGDLKTFGTNVESVFADVNASSPLTNRVILTGSRAVKSIATVVASSFANVQGATVAPQDAALSSGIFRLDTALAFVRSQTNSAAWKDAAGVCTQFVGSMDKVQWYGSWMDASGIQRDWDIKYDMGRVLMRVKDVCARITMMA